MAFFDVIKSLIWCHMFESIYSDINIHKKEKHENKNELDFCGSLGDGIV
jgi:hypothetical protein